MKLTARIPLRPVAAAAILLASVAASSDPIWQWPSLQRERLQKGRFFGLAAPSQPDVLAALHAAALAERTGQMERMERNVRANPLDLESRHRLAVAYQRQGRYQEAIAQYRQVLAFDRAHGCRVDLAALYEQLGRLDEAAQALSEVAVYHPKDVPSRKRLAGFLERLGKPKDSVRVRRELVAIAPRDHTLHAGLARSLLKAGQPAEACKAIAEAIRLRPTEPSLEFEQSECLRLRGDIAGAQKILEELAGKYPATMAPQQLGFLLLQQEKCSEALPVFEDALKDGRETVALVIGAAVAAQGVGNPEAVNRRCRQLRRNGLPEVASFLLGCFWLGRNDRTGLEAATALFPDASEGMAAAFLDLLTSTKGDRDKQRAVAVQVSLARAFLHAKWTQAATCAGEKALALAPESVLVSVLLAECYGAAGQKEKQLARLTDLARKLPRNDLLTYHLAAAQANAGLPDQARTRCIRLLDRSPGYHNARRLLADLHLWRGEYAAAAEQYQAMLRARPTLHAAHRGLVAALAAQRKYKDAATEIQRLERLDTSYEPDAVARVLLTLGRGDQGAALKKCEAALAMRPAEPRLRRLAGMILMTEGKLPQALPHLYAAAMVEPSHFGGQSELATVAERLGIRSLLVATCTKLAQVKPDDIAVQIRLARALRFAGRLTDALSLLEKLTCESPPLRREVQAELALGYLTNGDRARASKLARAVLDEEATHAIAAAVALAAYRASGKLTDAAQLCERMAAAGRGYDFTYGLGIIRLIQGRAEAAAGHLATATAEAKGKGSPPDPLPRAVALLGAGKGDEARAAAIEAAKHMPRAWQDRAALVVCLAATGAEKEAQEQLGEIELASADHASWVRAALPVFTSHPALLRQYLVGVVAWRSGWLTSAETLLAAARKSAPGDPVLLYASYLTARSARKHNEALALARQLVQVAPKAGLAHYAVGRAVVALGNTEAEAQAYATAMRLLGKQAPFVWDTMAKRLELIQRHGLAADAYRGLLAIQPESAPACNNLAWLYVRHMPDRLAEAETLATKAVKLAPASAAYLDTLGRIYYQRRNFDDAIRHLHKAIALDPAKASSYATLGLIYFEQKRPALARMAIDYALRRRPTLHDAESLHAILKVLRAQKDAPAKAK